ncbi:Ankyrin-1 [Fusarium oxysporum f. sp. albedinis]|nr:Ankyrin-1 [Fusarium oxysporum f. sp. albedinis]
MCLPWLDLPRTVCNQSILIHNQGTFLSSLHSQYHRQTSNAWILGTQLTLPLRNKAVHDVRIKSLMDRQDRQMQVTAPSAHPLSAASKSRCLSGQPSYQEGPTAGICGSFAGSETPCKTTSNIYRPLKPQYRLEHLVPTCSSTERSPLDPSKLKLRPGLVSFHIDITSHARGAWGLTLVIDLPVLRLSPTFAPQVLMSPSLRMHVMTNLFQNCSHGEGSRSIVYHPPRCLDILPDRFNQAMRSRPSYSPLGRPKCSGTLELLRWWEDY